MQLKQNVEQEINELITASSKSKRYGVVVTLIRRLIWIFVRPFHIYYSQKSDVLAKKNAMEMEILVKEHILLRSELAALKNRYSAANQLQSAIVDFNQKHSAKALKKIKLPTYLIVIPSSCQMYSGTGKALFDWIRFAKHDFQFSIFIDIENELNFNVTRNFCREHAIMFYSARSLRLPGCIDSGLRELNDHLSANEYKFIECVSWANASTNLNVLASKSKNTLLIYTPHSQPMWTLQNYEKYFMTSVAFKETLNAADFIFIDSHVESHMSEFASVDEEKIHFIPLGVDITRYHPGLSQITPHQILCICDCQEKRKRIDLVLKIFKRAYGLDERLRLVIGGQGSNELEISDDISSVVTKLGYVEEEVLIAQYQTSALFILLSDYEAFGLPIAEALCCGCPVLLNKLEILEELFSALPHVTFTNNRDIESTAKLISQLASANVERDQIAAAASKLFSFDKTYGYKRAILQNKIC